jgi:hypothetical protein
MTPRKSALISLTLNRGSQQLNNLFIIKYEQVAARFGLVGKADRATGPRCLSPSHVGTGSPRQAGDAFHAEYHLQRHGHIDRIDVAERRSVELLLDMLPRRFRPVILRQASYQFANVAERGELHHLGDDQGPR